MSHKINRRRFLQSAGAVAAGYWVLGRGAFGADSASPNEKLNIAVIGCGGMGSGHVGRATREKLVALCDVDGARAKKQFEAHTNVPKFADFREMFDKMHKGIDAVFVATPDHVHAPASLAAMKLGKHVYCQKPLAHNIHECRLMAKVAAETKVATQMGNQGHSSKGTKNIVDAIRAGVIGRVKELHCWCPKNFAAKGPAKTDKVPDTLNWDLWLGPATQRDYSPSYLPFSWRAWRDFGTGGLGDMACHIMSPGFWALDLTYPTLVEAASEQKPGEIEFAQDLTVRYDFPDRGPALHQKAVTVFWHHGSHLPNKRPVAGLEFPEELQKKFPGECSAFIGEKGVLIGDRGPGVMAVLPKEKMSEVPPAESRMGHEDEWIKACKEGTPTGSNFDVAAKLSETVLLGNVAWFAGKKLDWDGVNGKATNCPEADAFIRREYRKGWEL